LAVAPRVRFIEKRLGTKTSKQSNSESDDQSAEEFTRDQNSTTAISAYDFSVEGIKNMIYYLLCNLFSENF